MKLYSNMKGDWAGTQADARSAWGKDGWDEVDVPVSKAELLSFLNEYKCLDFEATRKQDVYGLDDRFEKDDDGNTVVVARVGDAKPEPMWHEPNHRNGPDAPINKYDIHDIAASASLKDLTQAMAVYLNRIDEELS